MKPTFPFNMYLYTFKFYLRYETEPYILNMSLKIYVFLVFCFSIHLICDIVFIDFVFFVCSF